MNEGDFQVRVAHKILGYNPIQKSFAAPKYVIKTKDPRLQKITVAEHGFFLSKRFLLSRLQKSRKEGQKAKSRSLNWTSPRTNSVHLTNSIRLRVLLVT